MKKVVKGDIFYADLRPSRGEEFSGIVPVLVLQNNISNISCATTIVAPITEEVDDIYKQPTHVVIKQFEKIRPDSVIMLEQIRVIDRCRLKGYIGMLESEQMQEINMALRMTFDI